MTTVLLVFPITLLLADGLDTDPVPLLLVEVIASNVGGTATLVGDPPNIVIGTATGLSFNSFMVNLGPPVVVILTVTLAILWFLYGRNPHSYRDLDRIRAPLPGLIVTGST